MKIQFFWNVKPCLWSNSARRFEHLTSESNSPRRGKYLALKLKALWAFETSSGQCETAQRLWIFSNTAVRTSDFRPHKYADVLQYLPSTNQQMLQTFPNHSVFQTMIKKDFQITSFLENINALLQFVTTDGVTNKTYSSLRSCFHAEITKNIFVSCCLSISKAPVINDIHWSPILLVIKWKMWNVCRRICRTSHYGLYVKFPRNSTEKRVVWIIASILAGRAVPWQSFWTV